MRHLMEKRKTNLFRRQTLKEALVERRSKLGESQSLQSVSRDADDIEAWISEKLQAAKDESYKDPSNIQVHYKFQNYSDLNFP